MKISKHILKTENLKVNSFVFMPESKTAKVVAIFTHGYTSSKSSLLQWATRLDELGICTVLFDQPGHYLGSFEEINTLDSFKNETPQLFAKALEIAIELNNQRPFERHFVGGHSLGALMAMRAIQQQEILSVSALICVGFGLPQINQKHVFQSEIFAKTIELRSQVVSTIINPDVIFPWINEQKHHINISAQKVLLVTGQDDVVVGQSGLMDMKQHLEKLGNTVELENPKRLPHNQPEMAASFIVKYIKENS